MSKPRPIRFVDSVRVEIEYPIAKRDAYFSVKIFEGKQEKERLGSSYDSDSRFEQVMQSIQEYLMAERFQYSSIMVFQTDHR
ncbi:MAG: SMI1/KNR4 family protein, partial [Exiguobacterium indicum]